MATDPTEAESCPDCGATHGVQRIVGTSPKVQAWLCSACRTDWAITVVNPRSFLDQLTATVELAAARSVLREIITLADQASVLTEEQLRFRPLSLAACAAPRSTAAPRSPIGHRSSDAPEPAPGGQPAPNPAPLGYRSNRPLPVPRGQPVPPPAGAEHAEVARG